MHTRKRAAGHALALAFVLASKNSLVSAALHSSAPPMCAMDTRSPQEQKHADMECTNVCSQVPAGRVSTPWPLSAQRYEPAWASQLLLKSKDAAMYDISNLQSTTAALWALAAT